MDGEIRRGQAIEIQRNPEFDLSLGGGSQAPCRKLLCYRLVSVGDGDQDGTTTREGLGKLLEFIGKDKDGAKQFEALIKAGDGAITFKVKHENSAKTDWHLCIVITGIVNSSRELLRFAGFQLQFTETREVGIRNLVLADHEINNGTDEMEKYLDQVSKCMHPHDGQVIIRIGFHGIEMMLMAPDCTCALQLKAWMWIVFHLRRIPLLLPESPHAFHLCSNEACFMEAYKLLARESLIDVALRDEEALRMANTDLEAQNATLIRIIRSVGQNR